MSTPEADELAIGNDYYSDMLSRAEDYYFKTNKQSKKVSKIRLSSIKMSKKIEKIHTQNKEINFSNILMEEDVKNWALDCADVEQKNILFSTDYKQYSYDKKKINEFDEYDTIYSNETKFQTNPCSENLVRTRTTSIFEVMELSISKKKSANLT